MNLMLIRYIVLLIALFVTTVIWENTAAQSINREKILGRWVSKDDGKYEIVFTKNNKLDYYDKKLTSTYKYQIKSDSLIAKDNSDNSTYYYAIMGLSKRYLTLMYLTRGNLLLFRRQ